MQKKRWCRAAALGLGLAVSCCALISQARAAEPALWTSAPWLSDWYDVKPAAAQGPMPRQAPPATYGPQIHAGPARPIEPAGPVEEIIPDHPYSQSPVPEYLPDGDDCAAPWSDDCAEPWGAGGHLGPPRLFTSVFENGYWLFRPYSLSWFIGVMWGDNPLPDVKLNSGFFGGFRLGWDFTDYWGFETRIGFSDINISDPSRIQEPDAELFLWDGEFLFYPLGDARLRPFFLTGLGATRIQFQNRFRQPFQKGLFEAVFGFGIRYRHSSRVVARIEFLDNIAFGATSGLEDMHNLSLTGGLEFHFGGSRTSYWPWNPGKKLW